MYGMCKASFCVHLMTLETFFIYFSSFFHSECNLPEMVVKEMWPLGDECSVCRLAG